MRIPLDESLPIELSFELSGHDVISVQKMGWSGLKNGELLTLAADRFEVMLTADQMDVTRQAPCARTVWRYTRLQPCGILAAA